MEVLAAAMTRGIEFVEKTPEDATAAAMSTEPIQLPVRTRLDVCVRLCLCVNMCICLCVWKCM